MYRVWWLPYAGCGKTTFLDLLTGRRKTGSFSVSIIILYVMELC